MIKVAFKISLLAMWCGLWFLPVLIAKLLGKTELRDQFTRSCCRGLLQIVGIHLRVTGEFSSTRPLLLVSNHLSYCDIPILGSHAALRFTPKREIANWPMIGFICKMTDCVFVDRRPEKVKEMRDDIHRVLVNGGVISLFPESTTGNGVRVLPFRSGFFNLAELGINGQELAVQPAAITYTRIRKLPIDSTQWPMLAWVGDEYLFPHFYRFLTLGPLDAELIFLPPVTIKEFGDRKRLASHCQQVISDAIESAKQTATIAPPASIVARISGKIRQKL